MDAVTRSIVAASLDASAYEAGARKVEAANQQMARSAEGVVAAGTKVEQTTMRGQRAFEAVQRELDRTYAAQQRYERAVEAINRAHERGLSSVQRHNELLELARQRYLGIGGAADGAAAQAARAATAFGGIGSRVQQAGYQLQDFVVQVQGGTSWMTALSQQGSQFLSAFGVGGAVAGAVLTVTLLGARFAGLSEEVKKASDLGKEQELQLTNLTSVNALLNRELETSEERQRRLTLARRSDIAALVAQTTATEQLTIARLQEGRQMITESLSVIEARRPPGAPPLTQEQRERILGVRASEVQQIDQEITRLSANIVTAESRLRALLDLGARTPDAARGRSGSSGGSRAADPELMAGWQAVQQQQRDLAAYDRQLNQEWEQEQRRRERDLEQLEERNTRVTDRIVDYSAERFADLFDENGRGWEGMLDTFERTARSTIARIAAEMVLKPVIAPVVQALGLGALGTGNGGLSGLGSLLGLGGGGTALVGGYGSGMVRRADGSVAPAAGGGSLSEYGSYLRAGQSLFSAWPGLDIAGGITGIGAVFNPGYQMATGVGFADSLLNTPVGGTWAPASAPLGGVGGGLGTTVGPSIGQIGLGVAGIAGGAYGIYSGLQRGGIGGYTTAAGGAAGVVGGAAGLATAAGLGGALGGAVAATAAFAPYVAAALLIAGALLPGQKAGFSGGDVGIGIGPDGLFNIAGSGGKRWNPGEAVASVQEQISGLNALMQRASIRVQNAPVQPNGYWGAVDIWGFGGSPWGQGDPRELFAKMRPYLVSDNPNIETMLRAGRVNTIEEYVGGADWIRQVYEPMIAATEATNAFVASIKAINDNFQPAIEGAQRLGLAEGALVRLREEQIADLYAQRDLSYLRGYQSIQQRQLVAQGRNYQATLLGFDVQSQDERSALIASLRDMGVTSADQAYWDRLYAYDVMRQTEQDTLVAGRNRTLGTLGTEFELRRLGALGTPESALQAFDIRANMEMEALRETLLSLGAAADDVRISMLAAAQATEREAIAKQQEQQRIGAGRDFLFDLTVGGLGGLAPEARYFAGLTAYNDARRSGDITRIADVARGFLPVARDFLGTSERYGELAAGIGRDVAGLGGDPAGLSALLDVQAGSLAAMERIANVNGLSLDEMRAMRGDLNRILSTIEALIARRAA